MRWAPSGGRLGAVTDAEDRYPWPEQVPWLRAVMVMSPDGSITGPDGRSGSISGPADREVLAAIRAFSDAVLIGAGTFRAERYRPMRAIPRFSHQRSRDGLAPAPRLVIVSGSLDLPWEEDAFRDSDFTPLVATRSGHPPDLLAQAGANCDVLVAPGEEVEPTWLVGELHRLGLKRIACEGGTALLRVLAAAGLVDEWDVTLSPRLGQERFSLASLHTEDGFVFTRFTGGDQ